MESFKTIDGSIITQKENNPSLAKDERDRSAQEGNSNLNFVPQLAGVTKSQQPLKVRNMATQPQNQKPHDQAQLLEKFRKLRQWQQQQQESMFRQQQQQMETLKMEQNKLQSILAAQKRLQEQQTTSSLTVHSPDLVMTSSKADTVRQSPVTAQSQPQQIVRAPMAMGMTSRAEIENDGYELVGHKSNALPRSIPTSSAPPVTMSQEDLELQMRPAGSQQYNGATERLEGSLASFNETVYPMMWNSSNYRLPLGSIPLSSAPMAVPLQGQPVRGSANSSNFVPNVGINLNRLTEVPSSFQSSASTQELGRLQGYLPGTNSPSHLEMNARESANIAHPYNRGPVMTQELEGLWSHSAGTKNPADIDFQVDEQSEADTMSGVYPLYDSEPEMCANEMDEVNEEDGFDTESDAEEDLEETSERNATVIELGAHPKDVEGMNEKHLDQSNTEVDDEMPIKPGIGGGSSAKTFEELLELQLKLDEASKAVTKTQSPSQKPQRTFLRKGQGLARFKGKSASNKTGTQGQESAGQSVAVQQRKEKKAGSAVSGTSQGNNKQSSMSGGPVAQTRVTRKVASKSPQVVVTEATEPATFGKALQSRGSMASKTQAAAITVTKSLMMPPSAVSTRAEESDPPGLLNSIDASFQMRLQELEEKQEMEEEELEEFELLEQAAANASFSSNSSVVVKVLAKARGNLQDSKTVISGRGVDGANNRGPGGILSPVDTGYGSGDAKVALSVDYPGHTGIEGHMNELQENDSEDEGSDVTLQEMSLDSALEPDDSRDDKRQTAGEQQKAPLFHEPTSSLEIEDDFNDEEAWGAIKKQVGTHPGHVKNRIEDDSDDDDDDSDVTISDIFPLVTSTPPAHLKGGQPQRSTAPGSSEADGLAASTPPTSALVTKLFPQLKPKQKAVPASKQVASDVPNAQSGQEKKEEPVDTIQSMAVREKLKELETEIDKFRAENAALAKMRSEREEGLKTLQSEIAAFEKQKTEELERLEQFREEELRKLRRERRVFEKYQKAARSMPDKKERDEIESLRGQIAELQEELKRRESRWSAASTRTRQRIEALEQQNKELQDEVKLLEHYRLQQWREDEQAKAIEIEESRPKKPLQRKTAKTSEEESGPRLPLRHRSPPMIPALVEAVPRSTPENATGDSENRLLPASIDANNNQAEMPRQDEDASIDVLSKSSEEIPQINSNDKPQEDVSQEIRKSKRSPRRRSKTPDSSEKIKRNVHFQDEEKNDQDGPREHSNLSERIARPDPREILHPDGKVEKVNSDGSRVITFANGTRKDISVDGQTIIVTFFNGDIKQIMPDQRVIYYYSDAQTTHTTYPDGMEVLQFPSKQIEKHYRDGTKEIIFPDQTIKYLYPNGAEECVFSDGTIQKVSVEGERTIEFPNGQRETHTKFYKKREYPDGTVKTVYPDGRTETRYATGRVRVKDRDGRVLVDSSNQNR
ncbi:uncharacterized protein LOC144645268 isoform X2 [Oculina patagonica]